MCWSRPRGNKALLALDLNHPNDGITLTHSVSRSLHLRGITAGTMTSALGRLLMDSGTKPSSRQAEISQSLLSPRPTIQSIWEETGSYNTNPEKPMAKIQMVNVKSQVRITLKPHPIQEPLTEE